MPKGGHIDKVKSEIEASVMANPKYKKLSKARKQGIIYGTMANKMGIKMSKGGHLKQTRKM